MTIKEAMSTYRLPNTTTPEDLECRWSKLLTFGKKVVITSPPNNRKRPNAKRIAAAFGDYVEARKDKSAFYGQYHPQ